MIQSASIRRAIVLSVLAHVVVLGTAWWLLDRSPRRDTEYVDIELAPPAPKVEALPAERVAKAEDSPPLADEPAAPAVPDPGEYAADAGIDAPVDAGIDAPIDAPVDAAPRRKPDAAVDAGIDAEIDAPLVAEGSGSGSADLDAGIDDAPPDDATQVAIIDPAAPGSGGSAGSGEGSGAGSDAREGSGSAGSGSGSAGLSNEAPVDGAPTTAGTAANLLAYFPRGHRATVLVRFDRLRGTEWAAQAERLLRPMPDYRGLFGAADAKIAEKLETIIISTPQPEAATETTLVARTKLGRGALRGFLGAGGAVAWSPAKGGLLGKRSSGLGPQDGRVFLSPFRGWFLLAQPRDLGGLTAAAPGDVDSIEATGRLPAWLSGIRTIEAESGDPRGPALVVTLAFDGKRRNLASDFGLGVKTFPAPERVSLAAEVVKQGWLVRGYMQFASDADAIEFVTAAETVRQRVTDSRLLQAAIGKAARAVMNVSFARGGRRVSYATSISISDMRAIMNVAALQLDAYFAARRP